MEGEKKKIRRAADAGAPHEGWLMGTCRGWGAGMWETFGIDMGRGTGGKDLPGGHQSGVTAACAGLGVLGERGNEDVC